MKQTLLFFLCFIIAIPAAYANFSSNIAKGMPPAEHQKITVLAPYQSQVRVLGFKDYQHDLEANFSPVDVAVSEGILASDDYYPMIGVKQHDRFLTWSMDPVPLPPKIAKQLVSNIHIIPANPEIAAELKKINVGDLVQLAGSLVEIEDNGWTWRSSLVRDDVGEGACEILRVDNIQWLKSNT